LFAVCCLASLVSAAQRYSFREYSNGLGNLNITCLAQDRTGYLWVGTQNGLYRYDGSQFSRYDAAEGLPERIIGNLFVAPDGTLWVGTAEGIYFQRSDGRFAAMQSQASIHEFSHQAGSAFTANSSGQVVTAAGNGAYLFRRVATDRWIAQPMNLDGDTIWSVLYGADGALWYGCDEDLCRLANGRTTRMRASLGLPQERWQSLLLARNGHIWLRGHAHAGELLPDGSRFLLHDLPGPVLSEAYPALAEDEQGRILTSQGSDLGLWEKDQWRMVTERNGLSRFEVQNLFVDREGSVWMGVVGHGLRRWVGQDRWEGYTAADGLSDDLVWASTRDHQGRLWIATESGLDYIPAGESTPRQWRASAIQTARAGSLEVSADGAIWMGSMAGSLTRIDPYTLMGTQWKLPEVYGIQADGAHRLWVATSSGLFLVSLDGFNPQPRLVEDAAFVNPHQRVTDLNLDSSGKLWLTSDQGLFMRDGSGWHRIDPGQSGAKPDLVAVDSKGNVWIAGPSQDLMRLQVSGYRVVKAEHFGRPPLLSEELVSLVVDHRGWVWVGQDEGVSVFDGHSWRSFTEDDGLIWNDTDSFALDEDKDGSMWIGTSGGLSHLISPQTATAGSPPAPVFSQVTYGTVAINNGAEVKWSSGALAISMAMLSFRNMHDVAIRYRLIGDRQSDWQSSHEMSVRYRDLAPGSYRFEVAAADSAGNAVSPVAVLSFRIVPLWWQSRLLQILLLVLPVPLVMLAWRRRVGQLVRQKEHLEEAVMLRTIDLEREKGELVRTRDQMRHFAEHDDLTGLWNHRIIVERLRGEVDRAQREGTPLSVIMVDLDHFKRINDTLGHRAGDLALKEVSAIFQRHVRRYDWVGRYGGEEFLLVLPGSSPPTARQRAEKLRMAVQEARVVAGDVTFSLTASFGVAAGFPEKYEAMIQLADAALYRAKNNGRNCVEATEIGQMESTRLPWA
jgi:diguanylate cyclase (GGDEF)-like protein